MRKEQIYVKYLENDYGKGRCDDYGNEEENNDNEDGDNDHEHDKKKLSLVLNDSKHKSGKECKYQLSGGHIVGKQQEVKYKKEENQSRDFPHMHLWYKHLKIL